MASVVRSPLAALLLLALVVFSARTWALSSERLQPKWDEVSYLALSRDYVREGGVLATITCHLEGRCVEVNRHPLFQLLTVPVTDDAPATFARTKLVTWATSVLLILVVALFATEAFDARVGVGTAVVLALSPVLADVSAEIRHDPLFTTFAVAALFLMGGGFGARRWFLVGALAGLAYLTKGSGHLVLAIALGVAVIHLRRDVVKTPAVYVAVLGFVAVAWWLLARNVVVYGSPFFNFNNRAAWLPQWSAVWELQRSAEWSQVGAGWFVAREGVAALVMRLLQGAAITFGVFLYAANVGFAVGRLTPGEVLVNIPRLLPVLTGVACVGLAVWGLVLRWRAGQGRPFVVTVVLATLLFWAALSVGAVGGHNNPRYVLVLTCLWIPFALHALLERVGPRRGLAAVAVVALVVQLAWYREGLARDPRGHFAVPEAWARTSAWLAARLAPKEQFALSYQSLYSTWDVPRPSTDPRWNWDFSLDPAVMARALAEDGVDTILVDTEELRYPWGRPADAPRDAHGLLSFDGWPRCFTDGGQPSRFLAFCRPEGAP